jgi:hypothetical protein
MKKKYTKRNKRKNTNKKYTKRKSKRSSKKRKTKKIMRGGTDYNPDTALSGWKGEEKETPQPQGVFIRPIKLKDSFQLATPSNPNIGLTDISQYQYRRMDMSNFLDLQDSESISAIDELYDCPGLQSRIEGGTGTHTEILPQVLSVVGHASYNGLTLSLIPEELTLYLPVGDKENFRTRGISRHTTFEEKTTNDLRSYQGVVLNYNINYDLNFFTGEKEPLRRLHYTRYSPSGILLKKLPRLENSDKSLSSQIMNELVRDNIKLMSMSDFTSCKIVSENEDGIKQDIHRKGDPGCNDYLNALTSEHESEFYKTEEKDGKEVLKEKIDNQDIVDLASVLKEINDVRERIPDYPSKVFGFFCRSGGLSSLVMKAMFVRNYSDELPILTLDYFKGNVKHIGADNLSRLSSLSSRSKFRNIWNILRKIQTNKSMLLSYLSETLKSKLNELLDRIYSRQELELTIDELRFIFQIEYFLLLNPNLLNVYKLSIMIPRIRGSLVIPKLPLWDYMTVEDLKKIIKYKALMEDRKSFADRVDNLRLFWGGKIHPDEKLLKDIDFDDDEVDILLR